MPCKFTFLPFSQHIQFAAYKHFHTPGDFDCMKKLDTHDREMEMLSLTLSKASCVEENSYSFND